MKLVALFFIGLICLSQANLQITHPSALVGGATECKLCISFVSQSISDLLQIIVNGGILGTCGALCSQLPNSLEQTVCNLMCDYVGIEGFIKLLDEVDPDPIYICEEITVCPINDKAAGNVSSVAVNPESGHQGATFDILVMYEVIKTIGTGQLVIDITPPQGSGEPFGAAELLIQAAPGRYGVKLELEAKPSQQQPFSPGTYNIQVGLCEGTCGSKHPHTHLLGMGTGSFQITN
eukprot:TRINITY_DN12154_c0_g1_i1.p1 TRINITY_DN12154_c0_g1~~TRINITY_DN12154_c0_g1_i1.p1  ORF type:complete len:235 (+),score=62.95 TRINITY_DN12154_c0_g1_i1:51-755(+)